MKENPSLFVPDTLLGVFFAIVAVILFVLSPALPIFKQVVGITDEQQTMKLLRDVLLENIGALISYAFIGLLILFIAIIITKAVKLGMIHDILLKKKASLKQAKNYIKQYLKPLIWLQIIYVLVFGTLGTIILVFIIKVVQTITEKTAPGFSPVLLAIIGIISILVYFKWYFATVALIVEKKPATKSLQLSNMLFKEKRLLVIKTWAIVFFTMIIINIVVSVLKAIPILGILIGVLSFFVTIAIGLWASLFTFHVYKLRKKLA